MNSLPLIVLLGAVLGELWLATRVSGTITLTRFSKTSTANWTPFKSVDNVKSILQCSALCLANPTCSLFDFKDSTCDLGDGLDITYSAGGKPGFFNHQKFGQLLTVQVLDSLDNTAIAFTTVSVVNIHQSEEKKVTTDEFGYVEVEIAQFSDLVVEISKSGFYSNSRTIFTGSDLLFNLTITTTELLPPNTLRGGMNWYGAISDLDLHLDQLEPTQNCSVYYENTICNVTHGNEVASIIYEVDAFNYGYDGGETLTFSGIFPNDFKAVIYVYNFAEESVLYNASLSFSLLGGPEPINLLARPDDGTIDPTLLYWIIGCFNPAAGLSSFSPINDYMADPFTVVCP